MGRHFKSFDHGGWGGKGASSTKSYHNGGVEGGSFADWYNKNLASYFDGSDDDGTKGSGSGGTKGSGSGGTKGSGSGGTKGSGSGGTKGSGSGGTKGSGSGGTKGSGSGGTKGSGSGGTKGSGSGGTKGSGSGGTKGSGSGGTKGSGSGGTKGSGSGGTKGSGSGGTKGSGSGGTKGSGSGGTKGSGSGGTKGSCNDDDNGGNDNGGDGGADKTTYEYKMGDPAEIDVNVTLTPEGTLFFVISQNNYEGDPADIDGILFNATEDSTVSELVVYPDEDNPAQGDLTDLQLNANGVTELTNGAGDGNAYDVGLQFGTEPDGVGGEITQTTFTLSSADGSPLSFEDIDLNSMKVVVNSEYDDGAVLGVSSSDNPSFSPQDAGGDTPLSLEDVMGLMTLDPDDLPQEDPEEDPMADDLFIV